MSTVMVITPIIIAQWPAIVAAVTAAMSTVGFAAIQEAQGIRRREGIATTKEEMEVEDSQILEGAAGTGETIVVQRQGVRATFSRDGRGALRLCMEGEGLSKSELRRLGEELLGRVTQQYAYHRVMTELKQRNMTVVDEQVTPDQTVKIRVRNW